MSFFQVASVLFALFMLYVSSIHKRKAGLSPIEMSFWYSVWFLFIVVAVFPQWLTGIAGVFNFLRVFDMVVVVGMMFVTTLLVFNYFHQRELYAKFETLLREMAIERAKKHDKKRSKN